MTDQNDNLSMEDILRSLTRERFHDVWEAARAGLMLIPGLYLFVCAFLGLP